MHGSGAVGEGRSMGDQLTTEDAVGKRDGEECGAREIW